MPDYTVTLSAGNVYVLVQNQIYALPPVMAGVVSSAVCQLSPSTTTTQFADVAATTTGIQTSAGFIRCTTGTPSVSVKRF